MTTPQLNPALQDTSLSVFEPIVARLKAVGASKRIPLHQGKTFFTTPVALREWAGEEFDYPPHHDGPSAGCELLVGAIRDKVLLATGADVSLQQVQVTNGVTHALSIAFNTILSPGDEVLVLSPHWLFVNGLVRTAGGVPIEVAVFHENPEVNEGWLQDIVAPAITPRTRAIYFNTPNNPTGFRLSRAQLHGLSRLCEQRGLWMVSDNAYEFYDFSAEGFVDPLSLPEAHDRLFSAYSFSKSFGMTGYRVGYLISPPRVATEARKHALYSIYSVPTCSQFVALSAMRLEEEVRPGNQRFVRRAMAIVNDALRVPATRPEGGFYTLLDLRAWPGGADDFIGRCVDAGVSLAPGGAFGAGFERYARLCYSVVDHDDLVEGVRIINKIYDGGSRP